MSVSVEQADRDAAADFMVVNEPGSTLLRLNIRDGDRDDHPLVHLLARYRQHHTEAKDAQIVALREALREVTSTAVDHFKKRNGHLGTIECDGGEKGWIVPDDAMHRARQALMGKGGAI